MQNISPIMASLSNNSGDDISNHRLYEQELPQDIWIEIFIRASVESLLRVKCVCTRWHALISNPSFTKKHLEFQKETSKNKGYFLLQQIDPTRVTSYFLFDVASVANVDMSSWSRSDRPHSYFHNTFRGHQVFIEGPVNGLYCVYAGVGRIVIWNPATKEVSFLPLAGECFHSEPISCESRRRDNSSVTGDYLYIPYGNIGFGTDPLNDEDYKVVIICVYDDNEHDAEDYCLLYTTNTNTWRILEDDNFVGFEDPSRKSSNNTFLNGIYYWFDVEEEVLVTFDMGKEIFRKISTPSLHSGCRSDLVVHNDSITLLRVNEEPNKIDVWELITEESIWIKRKSVFIEVQGVHKSLGFWKTEDEMLLVIADFGIPWSYHGHTVLYNTTTRAITNLGPRRVRNYFKAFIYYESLVSLSGIITCYKGNHASCLDAIQHFLSGHTMQDVLQRLEEH